MSVFHSRKDRLSTKLRGRECEVRKCHMFFFFFVFIFDNTRKKEGGGGNLPVEIPLPLETSPVDVTYPAPNMIRENPAR